MSIYDTLQELLSSFKVSFWKKDTNFLEGCMNIFGLLNPQQSASKSSKRRPPLITEISIFEKKNISEKEQELKKETNFEVFFRNCIQRKYNSLKIMKKNSSPQNIVTWWFQLTGVQLFDTNPLHESRPEKNYVKIQAAFKYQMRIPDSQKFPSTRKKYPSF